jgi:murein DD-endopeptidase MepM/ murein hydrolase activator NlpD
MLMATKGAWSRIRVTFWLLLLMLAACAAPQAAAPTATVEPTATATLEPTATATPEPTATATPAPTATLEATATATPEPTAMATPIQAVTITPDNTTDEPTSQSTVAFSYIFPVQGEWVDYGQYHHDYPAADIFCPTGSQFVAPTSGVIDFVRNEDIWSPANDDPAARGGMAVAMIGEDGVRYYGSHLSAVADGIAPGVYVAAGQLLGLTGNSGNARSTPPHLHFGISRPTTPDDWQVRRGEVPPYSYLRAWQRGENVTPVLP